MQKLSIDKHFKPVGSINLKSSEFLKHYCNHLLIKHLDIVVDSGKWILRTERVRAKAISDGMPMVLPALDLMDSCTAQTIYLYQKYKHLSFKNYVPSKPLVEVLSHIKADMTSKLLTDESQGYFELSHCDLKVPRKWVSERNDTEEKVVFFLYKVIESGLVLSFDLSGPESAISFFIPINKDKEENLAEVLKRFPFKANYFDEEGNLKVGEEEIDEEDLRFINLAFNLIIYTHNPTEEFVTQFNTFSKNSKHRQMEEKVFTKSPFIKLGFDAEFLRLITTEQYDVRGHWRWQPVGVGRMNRRLTFIKPHTRTQTKSLR